jgi:hypothetical protein
VVPREAFAFEKGPGITQQLDDVPGVYFRGDPNYSKRLTDLRTTLHSIYPSKTTVSWDVASRESREFSKTYRTMFK